MIFLTMKNYEDLKNQEQEQEKFAPTDACTKSHAHWFKKPVKKGPPSRKTIPTRYLFNHELEYFRHGNKEKKYALLVTKVKAARYEQEGIEELIPHLWSPSIHKYDINAELAGQKEYTFAEAGFLRLDQNDIEDLYLLKIQDKIHNIDGVDEFDLINALQLYIRRIMIKKRVEDAQLGVESYQTKA
ncbi:hypothetical protein Tco_1361414 [Tanacetum coccineum]